MNLETTSLEQVSIGSTLSHLVTYCTVVIIYLEPVLFAGIGNGPMKSMAQISNFRLRFIDIKEFSILGRGQPNHWHQLHWLTKFLHSLYRVGHHSPDYWIFLTVVSE